MTPSWLLALVLALGPRGPDDASRLTAVADDIWTASESRPAFCGPAAAEATAILLATVADHESGWRAGVQDCSLCVPGGQWCDHGLSAALWQLRRGGMWRTDEERAEICADNAVATRLALSLLRRYRRENTIEGMLRGYASGWTSQRSKAAADMATLFGRLSGKLRLRVGYLNGCMHAEIKP